MWGAPEITGPIAPGDGLFALAYFASIVFAAKLPKTYRAGALLLALFAPLAIPGCMQAFRM